MKSTSTEKRTIKGAHFFLGPVTETIYTPEDITEEQQMIANTVDQFVTHEYAPLADAMEAGEHHHNVALIKTLGDLGLLGSHMPEAYGGLELDTNTNGIITERLGKTGAFSTTYGAHTGIGMLPILYFGTEDQKMKYLPDLISGDKVACYCLTEPGSGSDALAAKSRADLSEDGTYYILNGQKMWISNAGFADIFIVFAKIGGTDFSAFIVEKGWQGLSLGAEEKKLGIKGSSTRQVFFENVHVPAQNLLGARGKGHHIAFNVLNTGRYKIGPAALGGAKGLIDLSINYANDRHQFGQPISTFGAVKSKIAQQIIDTHAIESAVYRTSGLINDLVEELKQRGESFANAKLKAAEEYALESSILKVAATDNVNRVAVECVQIPGGMGYSEETLAARGYRDSRIAMIYEGTNEINRMLMIQLIFKRAMKGQLDIATPAMKVQQELLTGDQVVTEYSSPEERALAGYKKVALMIIGSMAQLAMKGKMDIKHEQEIMINVADILIDLFLAESLFLRHQKNPSDLSQHITQVYMRQATERIRTNALEAVASFVQPALQEGFIRGIERYTVYPLYNVKELKRTIADQAIAQGRYNT